MTPSGPFQQKEAWAWGRKQMMEPGRPITVITLVRVCEAFDIPVEQLVASVAHHLRGRKKE